MSSNNPPIATSWTTVTFWLYYILAFQLVTDDFGLPCSVASGTSGINKDRLQVLPYQASAESGWDEVSALETPVTQTT